MQSTIPQKNKGKKEVEGGASAQYGNQTQDVSVEASVLT